MQNQWCKITYTICVSKGKPTSMLKHKERFRKESYDWSDTGIVNPEKNQENDKENTDDEDFVRIRSSNNECDDVIVLN